MLISHIRTARGLILNRLLDEFYEPHDSFLTVAMEIDRLASKDKYFTSRQLNANADLYGSFVYMALYVAGRCRSPRNC